MSKSVVQLLIDLALLLLTLLQGSSIEAVNPIKLCFVPLPTLVVRQYTTTGLLSWCRRTRTGLFEDEGTGAEDEGEKSTCFLVIDSCGQRSGLPDSKWHTLVASITFSKNSNWMATKLSIQFTHIRFKEIDLNHKRPVFDVY